MGRRQALLWFFILVSLALAIILLAQDAAGDDRPACSTEEACHFLDLALACEGKLDEAERRLRGETDKVRAATVTCTLTCGSCSPCECGGTLLGYGVAVAGGLAAGALICGAVADGSGVTVVR